MTEKEFIRFIIGSMAPDRWFTHDDQNAATYTNVDGVSFTVVFHDDYSIDSIFFNDGTFRTIEF